MQKTIRHTRFMITALILAALSLSLQSCGASSLLSKEPSPTWTTLKTSTPTETPSPTPTLSYSEWPLVMSETFDEANDNWTVGEMNNEYAKGTLAVIGGKYYIKLTAKKALFWPCIPELADMLDAYVSVKVDQISGSKTAEYGLILRQNANSFYFFSISTLQQGYELTKYSADGLSILTLWTHSSRILVGEPDQISVKAEGQKFVLFLNGEPVDDAQDKASVLGKVGIGIILYKAGDTIEITFDNFEVRSPEAA